MYKYMQHHTYRKIKQLKSFLTWNFGIPATSSYVLNGLFTSVEMQMYILLARQTITILHWRNLALG